MTIFRAVLAGLLGLTVLMGPSLPSRANDGPMSDAERGRALANLKWVSGPTSVPIGAPAARFDVGEGMMAVTGDDARRAWELLQTGRPSNLQAVILVVESKAVIFVEYAESGYVRMDDWDQVNPDSIMATLISRNRKITPEREQSGLARLSEGHWESLPQINRAEAVAHWAVGYYDERKKTTGLNVLVARLSRGGYARLGLALSMENYEKNPDVVRLLEQNFRFEPGAAYADHVEGEKLAPFGIARLVSTPIGAE